MRKKIYVAGNYSGNTINTLQNMGKGKQVCAMLFNEGFAPFCPWSDGDYAEILCDEKLSKQEFYDASLAWLEVSDAIYVISGEGKGGGVDAEIKFAIELGIPVFRNLTDLLRFYPGILK